MEPIIISVMGEKTLETNKSSPLDFCKYFKGEPCCPYENNEADGFLIKRMLWGYECIWVSHQESTEGRKILDKLVIECEELGLGGFINEQVVPASLVALLFHRFSHWTYGSPEDFKSWFSMYY